MRRTLVQAFLLAAAGLPAAGLAPGDFVLNGQADPVLDAALADARRILGPSRGGGVSLTVTLADQAPPLLPPPGSAPEAFREGWTAEVVSLPNHSSVRVTARDGDSAAAGIYAFLRTATGVVWLGPEAWEERVPPSSSWRLPTSAELNRRPPFVSRHISGLFDPASALWARRMGLRRLLPASHNLTRLFTPADLAAHPAWLGERGGKAVPPPFSGYDWQVDLTLDETVDHARARVGEWSAASPATRVFSLGMNDTTAYPDTVLVRSDGWFRGRPNLSDPVFEWTSRVASARTDLWFTALAYYYAENAPENPVAPNVVPWLTADRTAWSNASFRAEDTALISRWIKSGPQIVGIYDYLYGAPHLLPRSFEPVLADTIQTAHRLGVRAYNAELYPVWGFDGPKAYLAARLLDDPTRDPEALLDGYFREEFGPAAPAARRFWKRAAEAWARAPGPVRWIKFYRDDNQLAVLSDSDLRALRRELDAMLSSGAEGAQELAVHRLAEAWEVTELAALLHRQSKGALQGPTPWLATRAQLDRVLAGSQMRPGPNRLLCGASYILGSEPVERDAFCFLPPLVGGRGPRVVFREGAVPGLARGFRTLEEPSLASWSLFERGLRSAPEARLKPEGKSGLLISGQETLRLGRTLPVSPGELFAVGCLASGRVGASSPVAMELAFLDGGGRRVKPKRRERIFGDGSTGQWPLLIADRVPENAEWAAWTFVIEFQEREDRLTLSQPFSASGSW